MNARRIFEAAKELLEHLYGVAETLAADEERPTAFDRRRRFRPVPERFTTSCSRCDQLRPTVGRICTALYVTKFLKLGDEFGRGSQAELRLSCKARQSRALGGDVRQYLQMRRFDVPVAEPGSFCGSLPAVVVQEANEHMCKRQLMPCDTVGRVHGRQYTSGTEAFASRAVARSAPGSYGDGMGAGRFCSWHADCRGWAAGHEHVVGAVVREGFSREAVMQ